MRGAIIGCALAGLSLSSVLPVAARADETGFADMHSHRRESGKLCMLDHFHYGSSAGARSRKQAELAAISDWAGFTAFEYGTTWARFSLAGSKEMACEQSGGSWSCNISARPCKPVGRGTTSARKSGADAGSSATTQSPPTAPKSKQSAVSQ